MIADDEPSIRRLLQIQLERCGCIVSAAHDGEEALDLLKSKEFDIAILDVMMPYVDGLAVLRSIRNDPRTADLPVILLTVKAQDDDIYEGYKDGADMYLTKPFNPQEIVNMLCSNNATIAA